MEEEPKETGSRTLELRATVEKLSEVFPMVNMQAVRRQLAPREAAVG
jgi:hypothetical protein